MGKNIQRLVEFLPSENKLELVFRYDGDSATLEEFEKAKGEFCRLGLEISWVVVLRNISLIENQIWWQWTELIGRESDMGEQIKMLHKRGEYMKQARALASDGAGKGYDAVAFSIYSSERSVSSNYETVLVEETESELGDDLSGVTTGRVELPVNGSTLKGITKRLMSFFGKVRGEQNE